MKNKVFDFLKQAGIAYEVTEHEPVYTMDDMLALELDKLGTICKNLFLKDAKGKRHFIVVADNNSKINLKELGESLGAGKVSFASAERLQKYLGVTAGCVSPFGVVNDSEHSVIVAFDKRLQGKTRLGVHPNEHDATVWIAFDDLVAAVESLGNPTLMVDL